MRKDKRHPTSPNIAFSVLIFLVFFGQFVCPIAAKDIEVTVHETEPTLIGRVTNEKSQPLASIQVKLQGADPAFLKNAVTDKDGSFVLTHEPCEKLKLQILPARKSGLAAAVFQHLSGRSTQRLVVQLHPGLAVTGQVVGNQHKGLAGLILNFSDSDKTPLGGSAVHGGGACVSGHDGLYALTITPGIKRLAIVNHRYPEYIKLFETQIEIDKAGNLPEINLPPSP
jgi:hypothetical protein